MYVNMESHTFTWINVHSVYTLVFFFFFASGDLPTSFFDLTFAVKGFLCCCTFALFFSSVVVVGGGGGWG